MSINDVNNSFVLNDKKYNFLVEKIIGNDNVVYDFTNIFDENNNHKITNIKYAYCVCNGKTVLENFTNKSVLV